MEARSTHTVHVYSVVPGLCDAISRVLPDISVINVRTHGIGYKDLMKNITRDLTDEELAHLAKAEILLCDCQSLAQVLVRKGLSFLESLRWVHMTSAGVDSMTKVLTPGVQPPFILTRNNSDVLALMMTEYVVGQIVCHERGWMDIHQKQITKSCNDWHAFRKFRNLSQLTIGVMGLGKIGLATAKALKGFGCRVHGLTRTPHSRASTEPFVNQLWHGQESIGDFLKNCDYLVNLLPSTSFTRGLLGDGVLSGANKRPVLVNVGRGDIISEVDLLKALEEGWLSAAVLDCYEKEPVPKESLLWTHPKVVMTPHNSCNSSEEDRCRHIVMEFSANFENYLAGRPLKGQVDWQTGY